MTVRSQHFIIRPRSACPSQLRTRLGAPATTNPFDIDEVAACAWGEILQAAPGAQALAGVMEALLLPASSDLIWQSSGPGRGTEMRRAFSGMFGRFFARAYLQINHGYSWFNPIDGDPYALSPNWRVKRKPGEKKNMPDWICAGPARLAIGEAKGSNIDGQFPPKGTPAPIRKASEQIRGVRVERKVTAGRRSQWRARTVKGWAVMSRWGTDIPSREPYLYALDPDTDGEPLSAEERSELVQAVARRHVGLIARGLGLLGPEDAEMTEAAPTLVGGRRFVGGSMDLPGSFLGMIYSPFGRLDMGLEEARALAESFPDKRMIQFVGIDEHILKAYLGGTDLHAQERQRRRQSIILNSDGLIVAPLSQLDKGDMIE